MLEYCGWTALIPRDMNGLTGNGVGNEAVPHKKIVNQDFEDVQDGRCRHRERAESGVDLEEDRPQFDAAEPVTEPKRIRRRGTSSQR